MSYQKAFVFDPRDLVMLWCHYTDGEVPLGAQVSEVGFNPYLERMIGIEVESDEWTTQEPLQLRYEGKRVMSWQSGVGKNGVNDAPAWTEANDTPRRQ